MLYNHQTQLAASVYLFYSILILEIAGNLGDISEGGKVCENKKSNPGWCHYRMSPLSQRNYVFVLWSHDIRRCHILWSIFKMKAQNVICLLNTFFCHITHTSSYPPPPMSYCVFLKSGETAPPLVCTTRAIRMCGEKGHCRHWRERR